MVKKDKIIKIILYLFLLFDRLSLFCFETGSCEKLMLSSPFCCRIDRNRKEDDNFLVRELCYLCDVLNDRLEWMSVKDSRRPYMKVLLPADMFLERMYLP